MRQPLAVRALALLLLSQLSLVGCEKMDDLPRQIDQISFHLLGGTVFSVPDQVTMKEIHLDKGLMAGRDVVVEGQVVELGRFTTYMIMADETARMLVVLSDTDSEEWIEESQRQTRQKVKILGTIENGKKGLPYIQAKAVTLVPAEAAKG